MEKEIIINSHWGVNIKNEYISQDKDTLVILLPGGKYTNFAPLLYYSYNISLELGYDVLAINYGFQKSDKDIEFDETTNSHIIKETKEAIKKCLNEKTYKKIIFIGKCLGTFVQNALIGEFKDYEQMHVFMTPWPDCIEGIINNNSLVIVGTNDICFKQEHISKVANKANVIVRIIEDANHDLEKETYKESLKVLMKVTESIYEFIDDEL